MNRSVLDLFDAAVAQRPHAVAVVAGDITVSYAELDRRSDALAAALCEAGVRRGEIVAIALGREPAFVVAIWAVLKTGAAWLPLDPAYPGERLRYVLDDSGATVVVCDDPDVLGAPGAANSIRVVDPGRADVVAAPRPQPDIGPDDAAYLIYTSGSTGRPKGVVITHAGLANLVQGQHKLLSVGVTSRMLHFATPTFDASILEVMTALTAGAAVVLADQAARLDGERLIALLARQRVTHAVLLPSVLAALPDADLPDLRVLISGGEPVPASIARRWAPGRRMVNVYGPTEVSVVSTTDELTADDPPTIGVAVPGLRVELLDKHWQRVSDGEIGELAVGGVGLARCYHHRRGLTAERFIPDAFAAEPGSRLYLTGDLARRLPDGRLEFLGRRDNQVKVRGFRIELDEVAEVLREHPAVVDAFVMVTPIGDQLIGYVADGGAGTMSAELRDFSAQRLAAYMVPAAIIVLPALPLTPAGKVDRVALPPADNPTAGRQPETETEIAVAAIVGDLLGRANIGADDDFFALGGHSLLVGRLAARVRAGFAVELPLAKLFGTLTVGDIAALVEAGSSGPVLPPVSHVDRTGALPLSFPQERIWFLEQLAPGNLAYNTQVTIRLRGPLDPRILTETLTEVVRRHEIFRTAFGAEDGEPVARVRPPMPVELPLVDLSDLAELDRHVRGEQIVAEAQAMPFDLSAPPLARWTLLRYAPDDHVLVQVEHHFVHDGWSFAVLLGELKQIYSALACGRLIALPEPPVQFGDFAVWQRQWMSGTVLDAHLRYWAEHLRGAPPSLDLPADRPRPPRQSFAGDAIRFTLPEELSEGLRRFARRHGVTLYATMLAGFVALMSRYSRSDDMVVGVGVANRRAAELERLIGMVVNTLPMRFDTGGSPDFAELVQRVHSVVVDGFPWQDVPLSSIVESLDARDPSRNPLFQVMFSFHDSAVPDLEFAGLRGKVLERHNGSAKTDLNIVVIPRAEQRTGRASREDDNDITLIWEYATALFDRSTVQRMVEHFERLLAAGIAQPHCRVADLPLTYPQEADESRDWTRAENVGGPQQTVTALFARQVRASGDQAAIVEYSAGEVVVTTFRELDVRSNRVANMLLQFGVGDVVGALLPRGTDLIVAELGILKAGAAYMPLNPAYPVERLSQMAREAGATTVIAGAGSPSLPRTTRIPLAASHGYDSSDPAVAQDPAGAAYVMFTSGSTGRPKGIVVTHGNVTALALGASYVDAGPELRVAHIADPSFDASTFEVWAPLLHGGTVCVIDADTVLSPGRFAEALLELDVSAMFVTTALFNEIVATAPETFATLRTVLFGGERADPGRVRSLLASPATSGLTLGNVYGPTETTTFATHHHVDAVAADASTIPIGRPISGVAAHVLDGALNPAPIGVPGELYIGGSGVARGYLGQPRATAERFVPDPAGCGRRLYRTGDIVRWNAGGAIEFLGRVDDQVKIRGYRIEPGEVQAVLTGHPEVAQAVVLARPAPATGDLCLVAYVTPADDSSGVSVARLRSYLVEHLPPHLVPAYYVCLPELPLNPHGKVDRQALPAPVAADGQLDSDRMPLSGETQQRLGALWARLLGHDRAGRFDDFFTLGGHSLLAARLIGVAEREFGLAPTLAVFLADPTIDALARCIDTGSVRGTTDGPITRDRASVLLEHLDEFSDDEVAELLAKLDERTAGRAMTTGQHLRDLLAERLRQRADDPTYPLSYAQRRLWFLDQLSPGVPVYNVPLGYLIEGPLDLAALGQALSDVVRRHEVLRSRIDLHDGMPRQRALPAESVQLVVHDLTAEPQPEAAAQLIAAEHARTRFDLAIGPLLRAAVVKMAPDRHRLLLTLHHIACDAWSVDLLARELSQGYQAFLTGMPRAAAGAGECLRERPGVRSVQYGDYAAWQLADSDRVAGQLAYWREHLSDLPDISPMPTDHPRPPVQTYRGASLEFTATAEVSLQVEALARRCGTTPYAVLLSAFAVLSRAYSGDRRVVVGTPVANRELGWTSDVIGLFTNTLVLRIDTGDAATFADLVRQSGAYVREVMAYQDLPFELLVQELHPERDLTRNPLFQVMLSYRPDETDAWSLPGCTVRPQPGDSGTSKVDLTLSVVGGQVLSGRLEYATDLYSPASAQRFADQFLTLLAAAVAHPDTPLAALPILPAGQRALLDRWSGGPDLAARPRRVDELIAEQASLRADQVAVECGPVGLTYAELMARATALAETLRSRGAGPGHRIGVFAERGTDMVVALLGVLLSGSAYVPLDPGYPERRLAFVIADADLNAVVCTPGLAAKAAAFGVAIVDVPQGSAATEITGRPPSYADIAYVMYTSGSTGEPKGVMVSHDNLAAFIAGMDEVLGTGRPGTWYALTSIAFDISVLELLWTLARGYRVVVGSPEALTAGVAQPDFSLFYFGGEPAGERSGDPYGLLKAGARFADAHGFRAVWTPERHFHRFGGLYPNPAVTGAALAALTERVEIRAGSVVSPLHDALEIAEQWSVVDNLSGGRAGISFASGWHANDFVLAPDAYADRKQVMLRGIDEVRRLWAGGTVRRRNGAGAEMDVSIQPRPVQPVLPVWVTSARHPETFRLAGELGAGLLTHLLGHDIDELTEKIALYRASWRSHQDGLDRPRVAVMLHTFVGPDREQVRATVRQPLQDYLRTSLDLVGALSSAIGPDTDIRALPQSEQDALVEMAVERFMDTSGLLGTPQEAALMVARLAAIGVDEVACLIDFGVPQEDVLASLEHLARVPALVPAVRQRESIAAALRRTAATHLQCTPSLAALLLADEETRTALGRLERLLVGGESLPPDLAGDLVGATGGRVDNMYGPTEATIWASSQQIHPDATVLIGRPLAGVRAYVVDPYGNLVPPGVPGELVLGGEYVARGYWRRPGLTAERFIPDAFSSRPGARLYRTGDSVRWDDGGRLEFLGRIDDQVKIRGHRLELGEVDNGLATHPGVKAAVTAVAGVGAARHLVAFYLPMPGDDPPAAELTSHLAQRLPEAMIPARFVAVEAFPMTPNGKVDRRRLASGHHGHPRPQDDPSPTAGSAPTAGATTSPTPGNVTEEQISLAWRQVLHRDTIRATDDFFASGGNSLLVVALKARLREVAGIDISVVDLFRYPTIASLHAALAEREERSEAESRSAKAHDSAERATQSPASSPAAHHDGRLRRAGLARQAQARRLPHTDITESGGR